MSKIIVKHGKYYDKFPMTFLCEVCDCSFVCENIGDNVNICVNRGEVYACTRCPECGKWSDVMIDILPPKEDDEYD